MGVPREACSFIVQSRCATNDDEDELFQVVRGRLRIQFECGVETVLSANAWDE
jgi:hypothetical protein